MSTPGPGPWERRFDAALGLAASVILFSMMIVTFVDVVGRYGFNRPLRGAFEGTELMLLVLIFAGLTAFDTQSIKNTYLAHAQAGDQEWMGKAAIMGALTLYLDFINMFMFLLQFLGNRE